MVLPDLSQRLLPTTLILDSHDSYTRNLLSLISRLSSLDSTTPGDATAARPWDCEGWLERVVVVSVDSLDWCALFLVPSHSPSKSSSPLAMS
jgi:hypothetical protein